MDINSSGNICITILQQFLSSLSYIYIYIYIYGFATIDPLIFMKVYFNNQHLFTGPKDHVFGFLEKLKLKGINVIVTYSLSSSFFNENTNGSPLLFSVISFFFCICCTSPSIHLNPICIILYWLCTCSQLKFELIVYKAYHSK